MAALKNDDIGLYFGFGLTGEFAGDLVEERLICEGRRGLPKDGSRAVAAVERVGKDDDGFGERDRFDCGLDGAPEGPQVVSRVLFPI